MTPALNWLQALFVPRRADPVPPPVPTVPDAPVAPPPPLASMGTLTAQDRQRLEGVHPDLVAVVERARRDVPFFVAEGLRTLERQRQLFASGASKTMNSRHLTGHAVDLYPISDTPIPKMGREDYLGVVDAMKRAARALNVPMDHGYDWPWDAPHHELRWSAYPAPKP